MRKSGNSSFVLPDAVRIISNGSQHILVNTNNLAWVKISDPLCKIVSHLGMVGYAKMKAQVIRNHHVSEKDMRKSLEFLAARGILDKVTGHDADDLQHHSLDIMGCERMDAPVYIGTMHNPGVLLDVTDRCNLKCPYCYVGNYLSHVSVGADPPLAQISQIASALAPLRPASINLSGGEPLLRSDLVDIIATLLDIADTPIFMNTNGALLTASICDRIAPLLAGVSVSLDGSTAELHDSIAGVQGTFDKVINGIRNLQDAGLSRIVITSTICRQNLNDLPNMIEVAKSLDARFSSSFLVPTGCASINSEALLITGEEESKLEEQCWRKCLKLGYPEYPSDPFYRGYVRFARMRCPAFNSLYILTDGSIYPCPALRSQSEFYIGNAFEHDSIVDLIQTSPVVSKLASLHADHNPRTPECGDCDVRYFCGGGCLGLELNTEDCSRKKERLRKRLWQYQDGLSLSENIAAMYGKQPSQGSAE